MPGIINWNELWKATHVRGFRHHGEDLTAHWDRKAEAFNKRVMKHKERALEQVAALGLAPNETVLDMGSGPGRLAIPIARIAKSVTALDQSEGMLTCLKENMQAEGIGNINCIRKSWQDITPDEIPVHDVVLSSNSLGVYDLKDALTKMDSLARRAVFIFTFTDGNRDDGFSQFLKGEKHSRDSVQPAGYLMIYNLLAEMGICADVKIYDWESKEHYSSLDEAVASWKEMRDVPPEKEPKLREFLSARLTKDEQGLCMHRRSKHAMISWQKRLHTTA
ncbi:MAG: class I SAM-dependent methyltransferase [Methanothrix sp.]|nr:class I SAM-dependent methyltransferase [Methanothrix sp.]